MKRWRLFGAYVLVMLGLWLGGLSVQAGTIYDSPYVSFSPDRQAWTTNAGDQNVKWYATDGSDDVLVKGVRTLRELNVGEHYYTKARTGSIPVAKWQVALGQVRCCHTGYPPDNDYHGISFAKSICNKPHFSAWHPICADCGQQIVSFHIYMSKEAARSLDYIELSSQLSYYYLCPFNRNLEQGVQKTWHNCYAISYNRYRVVYDANAGGEIYGGYMAPSFHMYNNATIYDDKEVTPQTCLNPNTYTRIGWEFMGWNTEPDGSGVYYADKSEIYNLCEGDYTRDGLAGSVCLYAMWRKSSGILEVDPSAGQYAGKSDIAIFKGSYGESCVVNPNLLTPPAGYKVSFDTVGGEALQALIGEQRFAGWRKTPPFMGKLKGNVYSFYVEDGNVDRIYATYERMTVTLPKPVKQGYSFGGWYYDSGYTRYVGGAGTQLLPTQDMTLYAKWVELELTALDNYTENEGKGAVDLSWQQPDNTEKIYKLYQSGDGESWQQVFLAGMVGETPSYSGKLDYSGKRYELTVTYTGCYSIKAYGAQGGSYGTHQGGLGGMVSGSFWLKKGETIAVKIGGQNGYNGGGSSQTYGAGGGYTLVSSSNSGVLLIAGGGGGAGAYEDGEAGGYVQSDKDANTITSEFYDDLWTDNKMDQSHVGKEGVSAGGGGGGYLGGSAGEAILHFHEEGVCNHAHIGNASEKGGCYTDPVKCEEKLQHSYSHTRKWSWGGTDEEYCPNCGSNDCKGHEEDYYKHTCPVHGTVKTNTSENSPKTCGKTAGYQVGCGISTDYTCGYPYNGYVVRSTAAEGGSSYIQTNAARSYSSETGVNSGNGYVLIQLEEAGSLEDNHMNGVIAGDHAAPDSVMVDYVSLTSAGEDIVNVSWQEPKDWGTTYYHMVKSYLTDHRRNNLGESCTSNITANTLVSGIKGYLYCLDKSPNTEVGETNGQFIKSTELQVKLTEQAQYLHIKTIDRADNTSQTVHIPVGGKGWGVEDIEWPLFTEQLVIQTGENVYKSEDGTYYVKSDGETPFGIEYGAGMKGPAHDTYQINHAIIESTITGETPVRSQINVPSGTISDESLELPAEKLQFEVDGESPIQNAGYVMAVRSLKCRRLELRQELLLGREAHGKLISLVPVAGADGKEQTVYSDYNDDRQHGLKIIGDGEPPEIAGMDVIKDLPLLDRREESILLRVTAKDTLSGLKELHLEIRNVDNGVVREFYPDANGVVEVNISVDEPIFSGEFIVTAYATDRVGNEGQVSYGTMEFDLQAGIERILEPKEPVFKRGESGCLAIKAWGYVDKIEVEFPEEFTAEDESLNCEYVYEMDHSYLQEEELVFMIPLYVPENSDYTVTVRAYKGDMMLERHPALAVLGIEGTVLDELRTRLR
ncbi:MAG: InlB B-repeat-containing protein [Butyrivibrio sp.]|nr:InlB B-repeat-containing protein [Muribaculum sp.]MCM1551896.1 InlB B-repeat-containing protein [Butyrivibrio sp.]